jgi:hypothetical protein
MSTTTPLPAAAPAGASTEHDAKGRFVKGNKGGPGNPLAGKVNQVRKAFLEYFAGRAMQLLCEFMLRKALSGDPRFCRIILQYTIGKLPTDDGFADEDYAQAEAEALAELSCELEKDAGTVSAAADGEAQSAADSPAAVRREGAGQPTQAASQPSAPQPADISPARVESHQAVAPAAATLGAGLADLSNRPHSKNRERLLKLLDERDPLRRDFSAVPPSTNGLGDASHIPLVGT